MSESVVLALKLAVRENGGDAVQFFQQEKFVIT